MREQQKQMTFWLELRHIEKLKQLSSASGMSQVGVLRALLDMADVRRERKPMERLVWVDDQQPMSVWFTCGSRAWRAKLTRESVRDALMAGRLDVAEEQISPIASGLEEVA